MKTIDALAPTVLNARFSTSRNDLFWVLWTPDGWIRWVGYNDDNWWSRVAASDNWKTRVLCGKAYTLDVNTDEVTVTVVAA